MDGTGIENGEAGLCVCSTTLERGSVGDSEPWRISGRYERSAVMRWRGWTAGLVVLGLAAVPGKSCGPFFTEAVFVSRQLESRGSLMEGKLGIVWPDFGTVDLALVYRSCKDQRSLWRSGNRC